MWLLGYFECLRTLLAITIFGVFFECCYGIARLLVF